MALKRYNVSTQGPTQGPTRGKQRDALVDVEGVEKPRDGHFLGDVTTTGEDEATITR